MSVRNNFSAQTRGSSTVLNVIIILFMIFVLLVIMAPVFLRHDCGSARKMTCQMNLKECAIALQQYWNDYDGHLPSSNLVRHSKKWNRGNFETFATKQGTLPPESSKHPRTWAQVLYNHLGKNKDIMFCPSDDCEHGDPNSTVSYWWKLAVDKAWYGEGCGKPCRAETDFAYNADQIILYEKAGFHDGCPDKIGNDIQINVVYLDSHVKNVTIKQGSSKPIAPSAVTVGEPMYWNYDNEPKNGVPTVIKPSTAAIDPRRYSDKL